MAKPKQSTPNYRSGKATRSDKNYGTMPDCSKGAYGGTKTPAGKSVGQTPYPNGTTK